MDDLVCVILAAGLGKRMKSKLAKVLHKLCGKEMIRYVVETISSLNVDRKIVVVGYQGEKVAKILEGKAEIVFQHEQLGTGHAVKQVEPILSGFTGDILVVSGDTPLLTKETLNRMIDVHRMKKAAVTILTAVLADPTGYGRIIRRKDGTISKIVEEADATPFEKSLLEVNTGTYCFRSDLLFWALDKITCQNRQGEYYLTDVVEILRKGNRIEAVRSDSSVEVMGINNRSQLQQAEEILRKRRKMDEQSTKTTFWKCQ
ncbi:MAG: NTP transferase domain-containing protein [bacterium]|nr:NTP transferase domain-containing protein [bacterium]